MFTFLNKYCLNRIVLMFSRDAMMIAVMDVVTSLIAGFVIFTTFGGMAKQLGVDVADVAKSGLLVLVY